MKKTLLLVTFGIFALIYSFTSNDEVSGKKIPSVNIIDVDGNSINTSEVSNNGKPIIISFWATWCKPCKLELSTINEVYEDWQEETGVKLVAVSIDNERTKNMVKPYINAESWEYDVWMDTNGDLKRAMGVNNVPHTFLIDGNGNIVYSHSGFVPGDEEDLYDHVLELIK